MNLNNRDRVLIEKSLKNAGVRITKQRLALLNVLTEAEDHPDALELLSRTKKLCIASFIICPKIALN